MPFARADGSSRYTYPLSETQRFNADGVAVFVRKHMEAVRVPSRDGLQGWVSLAALTNRMVLAANANSLRSQSHRHSFAFADIAFHAELGGLIHTDVDEMERTTIFLGMIFPEGDIVSWMRHQNAGGF